MAQLAGRHDTVGIDLVAMSVNDALCCGAEPLFFLDYVAMSHDDPALLEEIVDGHLGRLRRGRSAPCWAARRRSCPICMPGAITTWPDSASGVAERSGTDRRHGDRRRRRGAWAWLRAACIRTAIAWSRKVVFDIAGLAVERYGRGAGRNGRRGVDPADADLRPRRCAACCNYYKVKSVVHGIAHITGGGLRENLERILPAGVAGADRSAAVGRFRRCFPGCSSWARSTTDEMDRVFNMGIGLVLVVSPYYVDSMRHQLADSGWKAGRSAE